MQRFKGPEFLALCDDGRWVLHSEAYAEIHNLRDELQRRNDDLDNAARTIVSDTNEMHLMRSLLRRAHEQVMNAGDYQLADEIRDMLNIPLTPSPDPGTVPAP